MNLEYSQLITRKELLVAKVKAVCAWRVVIMTHHGSSHARNWIFSVHSSWPGEQL